MISNIEKYSLKIVFGYFLLTAINGCLGMIGLVSIAKLDLLIMLSGTFLMCKYFQKTITPIDIFVIGLILSVAITSLIGQYNYALWYEGCRYQLYIMQFYFVGKYLKNNSIKIFNNGILPFLITCIVALVLYIHPPAWYINFKLALWEGELTEGIILEMMRLSAFWTYPYWVSYGCAILYLYVLNRSFFGGNLQNKDKVILVFIFFIAVLTQQRAPLFMISAGTIFYIAVGNVLQKGTGYKTMRMSMIQYVILLIMTVLIVFSFLSDEMLLRLLEKIEILQSRGDFLSDRADIFSDFYHKKITFWGDGIGRYSHKAFQMGKSAITDQQYMKILYETGYWGCFGYTIIIANSLLNGIKYMKTYLFELFIVMFYLMAMFGANCLSQFDQHAAIFWICCGRLCVNPRTQR